MTDVARQELLGALLKSVSRSFYLTLRVLPRGLREPIGLAYLLARAADTIADTSILDPEKRMESLLDLRGRLNGVRDGDPAERIVEQLGAHQSDPAERKLLESLAQAFELFDGMNELDRLEVSRVVTTLTKGMEFDLRSFPNETSGEVSALSSHENLEKYTYLVAGCVGEFWTIMTVAHEPKLRGWDLATMSATGIRFGKALQYTNILRDVPKDLRIGRCYFPRELLDKHGLKPRDLLDPANSARARPALSELIAIALGHYEEAFKYTHAIPATCTRLRLACLWPILIGLPTLAALGRNETWLNPATKSKVSRGQVKRILALSVPASGSDTLLKAWFARSSADVQKCFSLSTGH